jgi:hypothetical protein
MKNERILPRVKEESNFIHTIKRRKFKCIGHILRGNCFLKHVFEGKTEKKDINDGKIKKKEKKKKKKKKKKKAATGWP